MIRSKKFFTAGSIVAMSLLFITLMTGFVPDGYHGGYYYSYYTSFAEYWGGIYWTFFAMSIAYFAFSIVAIALYNKRLKAINIVNIIVTGVTYAYGFIVMCLAFDYGNTVFGVFLLTGVIGIAFPFHVIVDIFALVALKAKRQQQAYAPQQQAYAPQQQAYAPQQQAYAPQQQAYAPQQQAYAPQQQAYAPQQQAYNPASTSTAPVATPSSATIDTDIINTLKQLKELFDIGALTEEEYNEKRKQYLSKI